MIKLPSRRRCKQSSEIKPKDGTVATKEDIRILSTYSDDSDCSDHDSEDNCVVMLSWNNGQVGNSIVLL